MVFKKKKLVRNILLAIVPGLLVAGLVWGANIYYDLDRGPNTAVIGEETEIQGTTTVEGNVLPSTDNTYNLGSASNRWANIYSATATIGNTITIGSDIISGSSLTTFTTDSGNIEINPAGDFNVDSGSLFVDNSLNSVGINTTDLTGSRFKIENAATNTQATEDEYNNTDLISASSSADIDTTAGEVKMATTSGGGDFTCGDNVTFTYNGTEVTYGTVATSGECWMDRNLGASREAQSYDDSEAYGDLFQWGRPDDGHQERSSGETSTLASADHPGHSDFIKSGSSASDWRDPQNDNMWNTDGSGSNDGEICPEGWHVPSKSEWSSVSSNWSDRSDAFNSVLKLPSAGSRSYSDGSIDDAGSIGDYWCSSLNGSHADDLAFFSSGVAFYTAGRANGLPVRCIQDL